MILNGNRCALCGLNGVFADHNAPICAYHATNASEDWAASNRIMCDFFHRRKVPPRLTAVLRDNDVAYAESA